MEEDIIITLEDDSEVNLTISDEDNLNVNMSDRLTIVQPTHHNELIGLDYDSSGHTGFVPARLNAISPLNRNSSRLTAMVYVDDNGTDSKISMSEMFGLFLRIGTTKPADMQAGEYLFLEKGE